MVFLLAQCAERYHRVVSETATNDGKQEHTTDHGRQARSLADAVFHTRTAGYIIQWALALARAPLQLPALQRAYDLVEDRPAY